MATQIKVLRENLISKLASVKEDNVSIAGIAIERRKLLEALKLQKQADADTLTISYGNVSWQYEYKNYSDGRWELDPFTLEPKPCIQISCNHTTMRFMHCPKSKNWQEPKIIPLNFTDHRSYIKPELNGIPFDTRELISALTYALHGVATEESRPVLCCVLFDSGDNVLKLVSADGFRMPIISMPAEGIPAGKVLIHSSDILKLITFLKAVKPIGKGKGKYYPEVYLAYTDNGLKFSHDNGMIEFEKQDGTFPNYEQLIPKDEHSKVEFIASDMLQAVKSISNIANDGSGIIRLQVQQGEPAGKISVSASSEEYGESTVECDALVEYSEYHKTAPCQIAANNHYLIDLLKLCGDNRITLKIRQSSSPMVFEIGDNRQAVIMPMMAQW